MPPLKFRRLNVVHEIFLFFIFVNVVFVHVCQLYDFVFVESFVGIVAHVSDLLRCPCYEGAGAAVAFALHHAASVAFAFALHHSFSLHCSMSIVGLEGSEFAGG